jgi:hypothetical protein
VTIHKGIKVIYQNTFEGCESLKSVSLPEGIESIRQCVFAQCISLKSVTIPNSVASIGRGAFAFCTSLKSVTLSEGVTTIGFFSAFQNCISLESVTIPSSVTAIGENAFSYCNKLEFIIIDNESERQRVCALLPNALQTKVITQDAYQHHLQQKQRIIVGVLSNYILAVADNSHNEKPITPNFFTKSILPFLNKKEHLNGCIDLLRFIFSFLSIDDFKQHLPGLVNTLEPILLSSAPRSHPQSVYDEVKYTLSKKEYKKTLQESVTQYKQNNKTPHQQKQSL